MEEAPLIFPDATGDLVQLFQTEFEALGGHFYQAPDFHSLFDQLSSLIEEKSWEEIHCKDARLLHALQQHKIFSKINPQNYFSPKAVSITSCVQLIARTASIVFNSHQAAGRKLGIAAETHIVFAHQKQLTYNIKTALEKQKKHSILPSMISLHSGASRTADIEKTLVMGAHGPRALYLFLITS